MGPIHSSAPNRHETGSAGLPQPEEAGRIPASYDASQTISQTAGPFTHPVTSFSGSVRVGNALSLAPLAGIINSEKSQIFQQVAWPFPDSNPEFFLCPIKMVQTHRHSLPKTVAAEGDPCSPVV